MGDDFRVRLGGKLVTFFDQLFLQRNIVLDNAIVDHHDLSRAVAMRVGVFFGGAPVGGPAGVTDAVSAVQRLQADDFFQVAQLALSPAQLQLTGAVAGHGDAGGVVPAVLQLLEPVNNDGHHALFANIAYDSTHKNSCRLKTLATDQSLNLIGLGFSL